MPKPHTFTARYDEMPTLSTTFLSKQGYLKLNQSQTGTVSWFRYEKVTAQISIEVHTHPERMYLELRYRCNGSPINYKVRLFSTPSNLGKGVVWYFICPRTGKRCRKLYLAETYFYHRSAFKGYMYETQTRSKQYRSLEKTFGQHFRVEELFEQLYSKHFKKHYAGKPTKKYLKLKREIENIEGCFQP